ncbi:MAG: tetratricopeptide repeat protein [Thermoanaerobaculia bacterium]
MRRLPSPLLLATLVLAAGCSEYQAFDSTAFVREQYAERLRASATDIDAGSLEVPFELDQAIVELVAAKLHPRRNEEDQVTELIDFIFRDLDLQYSLTPTRNAIDTYHHRRGNCLSFVNLFVGIGRRQRLNPFYVEVRDLQRWRHREGTVVSQGHIVAGMYVDGDLRTFDFLPYRPKSYKNFRIIDDLQAASHYYNNLGAEALLEGDDERAESLLRAANALAPDFEKAINNLGVFMFRDGRVDEAIEVYRRGLELDPDNVALLTNLASAYQRRGESQQAAELFERLGELRGTSPYFFVYRGELALSQGDAGAALRFMRQALKRDSEIPEVHIGLAKVYMSLGELDKARHHLGRALKLDATHDEARRYAALLEAR